MITRRAVQRDVDHAGPGESAGSLHDLHLALLQQPHEATMELSHHRTLALESFCPIELRLRHDYSELGGG